MSCFCYILECADGTYYTGWTTDPERRLRRHNAGHGSRYTHSRRPVKIVYIEQMSDRGSAMRREKEMKKLTRIEKHQLVLGNSQPATSAN